MEPLGSDEYARAIERRNVVREKIRHDAREMIEVLRADVPAFFAREAKRRFVAAPELAEKLDGSAVAKIKKAVQGAGERTALEVAKALEPDAVWQWTPSALPEMPRLEANPRIASALAKIGEGLAAVLGEHGFPDAASARDSYKLPSYFVAGRFMKSLVESYWRNLQEDVELTRLIEEAGGRERREKLAKKWDQA